MNLKRSDVMRRILDAQEDGAHAPEALIEKLDQLDDPAFWAWWQENEKERHMRAAGWTTQDGKFWFNPKPYSATDGGPVTFERAWGKFRIEQGGRTMMPMLPIMLAFDPAKQEALADIFSSPTAWTLWLLWKARHIVSQHFNNQVREAAKKIDEQHPTTPEELKACFPRFMRVGDFAGPDLQRFCEEAVPFFTGEKEVDFVINPPREHGMPMPTTPSPMKAKPLLIALIFAILIPAASAQSPFQREAKTLWDQKEKATAETLKVLNSVYQTNLEKVYWRAMDAKDPAADLIRKELETMGPLRPRPAPPKTGALPKAMVGKWDVNYIGGSIGKWEFAEDGTVAVKQGAATTACTWEKEKDAIKVTYPDGGVTELAWPIKGGKTEGHDAAGRKVWLSEAKK